MSELTQDPRFAATPDPPYYAVIFVSLKHAGDDGYAEMAQRMLDLALTQPGCLGADSARDAAGFGLTVAYFTTLADI